MRPSPKRRRNVPEGLVVSDPLKAAAVLGVGLGGFFDGILLHQILQWHHMLGTALPPDTLRNLELNTVADGLFHGATWVVTLVGIFLLARSLGHRRHIVRVRRLVGGMLIGWGLFNLVEGIVDHHLLQIHHVRPGPNELLYDVAFLAWGAIMLGAGVHLSRPTMARAT
jgi:uncharacterized membrane protein